MWRCSQYLNRYVGSSASLELILVDLKGGCYIKPILLASLADLVTVRQPVGGGSPKSGGVSGSGGDGSGDGSSGN